MLKRVRGMVMLFLLAAVVLLPVVGAECAPVDGERTVRLGNVSMELPASVLVSEFDFASFSDAKNLGLSKGDLKALERIGFFQVAAHDGKNYRMGWFFVWQDEDVLSKRHKESLSLPLSKEKKAEVLKGQADIRAFLQAFVLKEGSEAARYREVKKITYEGLRKPGIPLIIDMQWPDIKFPMMNGQQAYSSSFRILADVSGLFVSFYSKGYFFNVQDHGTVLMFACMDSERDFWTKVFDQSVKSVRKTGK